ncbi:hypothetical protein B0H14DRAFT_3540728 [Mycena olivaceomarginata]|nr:hypothetical protein B0H14DRAFT_3540728 [Mycena olivaceomarginata]
MAPTTNKQSVRANQPITRTGPELRALQAGTSSSAPTAPPEPRLEVLEPEADVQMPDWVEEDIFSPSPPPPTPPTPLPPPIPAGTRAHRTEQAVNQVALAWDLLLPQLVDPYAQYQQASHGQRPSIIPASIHHEAHATLALLLRLLSSAYMEQVQVTTCKSNLGLGSPSTYLKSIAPSLSARVTQSPPLLQPFTQYMIGVASGFFHLRCSPGMRAKEPFREGLGNAVMWSSHLRDRLQARLHATLAAADQALFPTTQEPASVDPAAEAAQASEVSEVMVANEGDHGQQLEEMHNNTLGHTSGSMSVAQEAEASVAPPPSADWSAPPVDEMPAPSTEPATPSPPPSVSSPSTSSHSAPTYTRTCLSCPT